MKLDIVIESGMGALAVDSGPLSRADFDLARNRLVVACARFGTVGPSGQLPVPGSEVVSLDNPEFYIVDDKYNDDRRLIVEPLVESVSTGWLEAVAEAMEPASGWDVLMHLGGGIDLLVSRELVRVFGFRSTAIELEDLIEELRGRRSN